MVSRECLLIVFAKAPIAGRSKTRLIPALGEEGAAALQNLLIEHTIENLLCPTKWRTQLCVTERHSVFDSLCAEHGITHTIQRGKDLGARMFHALTDAHKHYDRVVLVGTDCPSLRQQHIVKAFQQLQDGADYVIAPAFDGGYVLIGSVVDIAAMFELIAWGGETVLSQTLKQAARHNVNVKLLETLQDIDRPQDLLSLTELESFQAFASECPSPPGLR